MAGDVPNYYKFPDCDLTQKFKNFDSPTEFQIFEARARQARSESFVLDYGEEAWCAFDLSATELSHLINAPRPPSIQSRWIHVWYPHLSPERIETLAQRYQFSPRLARLMQSNPLGVAPTREKNKSHDTQRNFHILKSPKLVPWEATDAEQALQLNDIHQSDRNSNLLEDLGHYDIVNSIWHWSSIDLGKNYLCLGYNSLHNVTVNTSGSNLPDAERVWNWLILGDDDITISISESKLMPYDGDASGVRRTLINVFQQLSKATDRSKRNPISILPLRLPMMNKDNSPNNAAGIIFYYLFDDWDSTYSLLAKREHQYGYELNELRTEMMKHAKLSHVNQLFRIGRQLATLKRIYQSYELLIDKILEKNRDLTPKDTSDPQNKNPDTLGVRLDQDVLVRFERLRDRIELYVLSEIKECNDTKDSLLMMNFNLLSIKEANAVERLTRITILLAKVTILFLPVSLVTGYFSINFPGLNITQTAFWIAFAVVLVVSFLTLYVFGRLSGTTEGNMVYQPVHKVIGDMFKHLWRGNGDERDM